jgi:hypothetical protein
MATTSSPLKRSFADADADATAANRQDTKAYKESVDADDTTDEFNLYHISLYIYIIIQTYWFQFIVC